MPPLKDSVPFPRGFFIPSLCRAYWGGLWITALRCNTCWACLGSPCLSGDGSCADLLWSLPTSTRSWSSGSSFADGHDSFVYLLRKVSTDRAKIVMPTLREPPVGSAACRELLISCRSQCAPQRVI
ncbi:hypothetical protein FA95DRAFT_467998 [Auriscalpium vulgare]|uniref:Uncharacterized protein n=1 Tax=Auriscalpium vulgare TaxID=40419 RepID=A0ACB8SAV1_9AGAM|nr:hypothetical protein FA95DRAFT_467998 [Auriscalpium vulgare]